jgi:hypothetical protein
MSDQTTGKPGPTINPSIREVQAVFPNDGAMQDAIAKLTLAGFDRAALSLPVTRPDDGHATPEQDASPPVTDTDVRQARTMGTSMAGTIGAFVAAGAVAATGGAAAVAAAAAAAVGAGSALTANAVGNAADQAQSSAREEDAAAGRLVLSVYAPDTGQQAKAEQILRDAGASEVAAVERTGQSLAGIDSSRWTG